MKGKSISIEKEKLFLMFIILRGILLWKNFCQYPSQYLKSSKQFWHASCVFTKVNYLIGLLHFNQNLHQFFLNWCMRIYAILNDVLNLYLQMKLIQTYSYFCSLMMKLKFKFELISFFLRKIYPFYHWVAHDLFLANLAIYRFFIRHLIYQWT